MDERAEGVLELEGDGDGKIIVTKKDGKLDVRRQVGDSAAFEKIPAPQRFLDALFDAPASNPVMFLTAKDDRERIQRLLEAIPLELDLDDMWSAIGIDPAADKIPAFPTHDHPLRIIASVREAIFDTRTGTNTTARDKMATAEQIRRDIPAEQPDDIDADEKQAELDSARAEIATARAAADAELRAERSAADAELRAERSAADAELAESEAAIRAVFAETKATAYSQIVEIRAEAERKIAEITTRTADANEKMQASIAGLQACYQARMSSARELSGAKHSDAETASKFALEALRDRESSAAELAAELSALRERQKNATAILALRNQADKQEAEAIAAKIMSDKYTAALAALDVYKAEMTKNLPIAGLDLSGGEITVNGIPWRQLNTAQQIKIAVQVSCLRFGDKSFRPIFVDGAEALDEKSFALLEAELSASGAQAFIARVSAGNLSVNHS